MTKCVEFNWLVPVPQELLEGTTADKWVEEKDCADLELEAFFRFVNQIIILFVTNKKIINHIPNISNLTANICRVDEYGFFIYWKSEGREGDVKELSQVNDIRMGELPKVKRGQFR